MRLEKEIQVQRKIAEVNDLIGKSERILITAHENPDGDSIGSQIALGEYLVFLGKNFWIFNQGTVPYKYKFIDPKGLIRTEKPKGDIDPDLIVVVECPNLDRIGWVKEYIKDGIPLINIDHHQDNKNFGTLNFVDVHRSAAGELIYDIIRFGNYKPNQTAVNAIYLAIYTDTGRFRHDSTTPDAFRKCAELLELGANPRVVADNAYYNMSAPSLKLLGGVLSNLELPLNNRVCFLTVTPKLIKASGAEYSDTEGIIDYGLYIDGVLVTALFKEIEGVGEIKVSFRCREEYDILPIAKLFGGGGHHHAAGCSVSGPLDNARKIVLEALERMLDNSQ